MTVSSLSASEIVAKAEECYALGLITLEKLELVTRRAYSEPGYSAILDLPLTHELENERALRRQAEAAAQKTRRRLRLRRLLFR